jgi:uncharacterized cupredoxin-like copper-binding protein
MRKTVIGTCALLTATLAGGALAPAHAQEATPEAVSVAECQVEPRSLEFFQNLAATPAPATEENAAAATGTPEASLDPVDEATLAGITATAREVVACLNAGDFLRVNALYTDDYLLRNFGQDDVAALGATPSPAAAPDQVLFRGIRDTVLLGDGRVLAVVQTTTPTGDVDTTTTFEQSGDRWLIDDESVLDAGETGDAGAAAGTATADNGVAAGTAAAGAETGTALEVVSYDIYFEPSELMITANTDVTVTLPNEGVTLHNFAIDELGVDVDINPGSTEEVVINAPAGTYEYYCNVPGHKQAGMKGTLTVG